MKKLLALILIFVLAMSLIACDSSSGGEIKNPSSVSTENNAGENQQKDPVTQPENNKAAIEEVVLVDEAGVKITAKSLDMDSLFGPELKLLIENNSGQDLTFQSRNVAVNGYMVDTMMSVDVVNGKKANDSLTFMESSFKACGIESIADIELSFHVFYSSDWKDYLDTDAIQIKTSIADTYTYTFDDSGESVYDGNDVKIVVKGLAEDDSILGPGVVVYIENNGSKNVTVQTRDVSINGFMVDDLFSCDVVAGKRAVDTITFLESDLEENEITAIEDVELSFHIFDADGWDTIADTEVVKIVF